MSARVSVLMPFKDAERFVGLAATSLARQTYQDFLVVAVDDNSSDMSRAILSSILKDKVKFVNTSGVGVTKALNAGLKECDGEFVARMDADDESLPERLERQVSFLDANEDVGVLGTRFLSMDEGLVNLIWDNHDIPLDHDGIRIKMVTSCCIGHPTVMARTDVLKSLGGYDESDKYKAVEDYELWLRALAKGVRFANLPDVLLRHRVHGSQVSKVLSDIQERNTNSLRQEYRFVATRPTPH